MISSPRLARRHPRALACLLARALSRALAGVALSATFAGAAAAQGDAMNGARVVRSPAWRADSMAVGGDSAGAVALLDSAVRANRQDAEAWYRLGMIQWAMARSHRKSGFIKDGTAIRRLIQADTALRLARRLAPDSARYAVALARFFLNSNTATLRFQAHGQLEHAVERAAHVPGNEYSFAEAADELGMSHWRRYEIVARRRMVSGLAGAPPASFIDQLGSDMPSSLRNYLETMTTPLSEKDRMGDADYLKATELFERAIAAFPEHPRARRHLYMALADRERWEELERNAGERAKSAPWDASAHFALGLAAHMQEKPAIAQAAFDTALVLVTEEERGRLTNLARILRPSSAKKNVLSDSARYLRMEPTERAQLDSMYWQLADPLALTPHNEHRLEFLARVAYAELMWTSEDLDRKGADSDRGDIWIRFGPPDLRASFPGKDLETNYELWRWNDGRAFVFLTPPTWGTARFAEATAVRAPEIKAVQPAGWSNVPIDRRIDSIPVQIARFRAEGDSADLLVVAELPVPSMLRGLDLVRAPVDVGLGIYTGASTVLVRDSTRMVLTMADTAQGPQLRAWRERVPAGAHVYRIEALQPEGVRGARAMGRMTVGGDSAFGLSDVLAATRVSPREGVAPARWRDLNVLPTAGKFAKGAPIGLVWETYGLQASPEGGSRYRVVVTLERREQNKVVSLARSVVTGVTGVVSGSGVTTSAQKGRVTMRYERSAPAAPVALDYLTLDVPSAPAGKYVVTIAVTDLVANRTTSRTREVRIE